MSGHVGWAASGLGDASHARVSYEAAVRVGTEVGDDVTVAAALGNLADLALTSGAWAEALAMALRAVEQGEQTRRKRSHPRGRTLQRCTSPICAWRHRSGVSPAIDALTILREADRDYLNACVLLVAALHGARGESERAARLLGTADALTEQSGSALQPAETILRERTIDDLQRVLGRERFGDLHREGRSLDETAALDSS